MQQAYIKNFGCIIKYIDRYHLKVDLKVNIARPIDKFWVYIRGFRKYSTYTENARFWINVCDWLAGKSYSFVLEWIVANLLNHTDAQTNLLHLCPFNGYNYLKFANISTEVFSRSPMMAAADYRLRFDVYTSNRKTMLAGAELYFSVSEHRVEVL